MFRSSPLEVFARKMLCKHEAHPGENNRAEARSQQSYFATLLKSHPRTYAPPKICSTSAGHPPPSYFIVEHILMNQHTGMLDDFTALSIGVKRSYLKLKKVMINEHLWRTAD